MIAVVGTDTGVGKTCAVVAYLGHLREKGIPCSAIKPYVSGMNAGGWDDLRRLGIAEDDSTPARFQRPLSPYGAQRRGERAVPMDDVREHIRRRTASGGRLVIEGIGGVMVPLEKGRLWIDLHAEFGWPALVVARAGLGTLNHTLLTLSALRERFIPLRGFILAASEPVSALDAEENAAIIGEASGVECLGIVDYDPHDPAARWRASIRWEILEGADG